LKLKIKSELIQARQVEYLPDNELIDGVPNLRWFNFTSGMIFSNPNLSFWYGKYEIRCKIPSGAGFWPAFWTFSNGPGWHEIDIFEFFDDLPNSKHRMDIHHNPLDQSSSTHCPSSWNGPDFSAAFHTFTMIWNPTSIEWYVDGVLKRITYRFMDINGGALTCEQVKQKLQDNPQTIFLQAESFPRRAGHIIVNAKVHTQNANVPNEFEIDYIRYWRQEPLPVQTPPCLMPNTRKLANGFLINGKRDKVIEICLNDPIILSGVHPNPSCPQLISPNIHPENRSIFGSCSDNDAFQCNSNIISCICWFSSLFISVTLVNDNLTPVGPEFTKWQNFKSPDLININGINGEFYLNPIDLRNYLPSPFIIFQSGQTYRIKIANTDFNGWSEYTNYIHFFTNNRTITGQNITSNVYGKNITILNSTVSQPIEVVASESIVILPNSTLNLGTYRIDEGLNCNSFLRVGVPNNETYSKGISNNSLYYQSDKEFEVIDENSIATLNQNRGLLIFPNPTNGLINIELNTNKSYFEIEVFSLLGELVYVNKVNSSKLTVNLSEHPKGMYLIKIKQDNNYYYEKISRY